MSIYKQGSICKATAPNVPGHCKYLLHPKRAQSVFPVPSPAAASSTCGYLKPRSDVQTLRHSSLFPVPSPFAPSFRSGSRKSSSDVSASEAERNRCRETRFAKPSDRVLTSGDPAPSPSCSVVMLAEAAASCKRSPHAMNSQTPSDGERHHQTITPV